MTQTKLSIFDIDDTLFKTSAKILLKDAAGKLRPLTSSEFNSYSLKENEKFDFSQFINAELFHKTSIPISSVWKIAQESVRDTLTKTVVVTARSDFDNKDLFLETFDKHGLDTKRIHIYRAGNILHGQPMALKKKHVINELLKDHSYSEACLYDDHFDNLTSFLSLIKDYPNTIFKAYHVNKSGVINSPIIVNNINDYINCT